MQSVHVHLLPRVHAPRDECYANEIKQAIVLCDLSDGLQVQLRGCICTPAWILHAHAQHMLQGHKLKLLQQQQHLPGQGPLFHSLSATVQLYVCNA